jgi:TM2 domain-containing membrane protein YozV
LTKSTLLVTFNWRQLSQSITNWIEMSVEYTDAPAIQPASGEAGKMPCPYCGHLLPKDAQSCDRCDWTRSATTETAEGKASDAVAVLLSIIPGLGHIYKGHRMAGFLWMAGAVPAGIFVFLAAIASAGFGIGLFFFYLIAVMLHAYAVDDRVVAPTLDEGEEY